MKPVKPPQNWTPIVWVSLIVVMHLILFSLRDSTVLAAPGELTRVDNLSEDQLYDRAAAAVVLARKGHDNKYKYPNNYQGKWSDAAVYLSAFLGRISADSGRMQEAQTYQKYLDEIQSYINDVMLAGTEYKQYYTQIGSCLKAAGVPQSYSMQTNPRAPSPLPSRPAASSSSRARAPESLFSEEFNGPNLNPVFQEGLPDAAFRPNSDGIAIYDGAPMYSFDTWSGGAKYLRMFSNLNDTQRKGWRTSQVFNPGSRAFRLELRFNTRTQSRDMGIDQLLEVWLIDADNQHKHIRVTVFSDGYGANRMLAYTNTLIGKGEERGFGFEDNKWYRLVVTGSPNQTIKAAVFDDSGTKELVSLLVGSNLGAFPKGFRLGLSQSVGYPGGRYPTDVGIDWMRLTAE